MAYNFSPLPIWQMIDGNGDPYAGGLLYTYEAGGTTAKATYDKSDSTNSNPVVFDPNGRATIKLAPGKYHMIFTDGVGAVEFDPAELEGTTIWDIDNIGSDIQSISTVETLADLAAIAVATINIGDAVVVQGYASANDGGGGLFTWDATSTATDDGGICIKPTDGTTGRWVRLYNGGVNPRWFGASGDGTSNDGLAFRNAVIYAAANNTFIELDHGTFNCASDPETTTSNPVVVFNQAIIKWSGFALNINPLIPISDTNRHFNYTPGAESPVFPATAEIKNIWLDGTTAGWYQTTLALQSDMTTAQADIVNLKGALNTIVVVNDNGGTWVAGSLVIAINGTSYTQSLIGGGKDDSLDAIADQIAAHSDVDSATYTAATHTIAIIPNTGKSLFVSVTTSGLSGGSTVTFNLTEKFQANISTTQRILSVKGADVGSANNMTLGNDGNYFNITGSTQINLISSVGWAAGSIIHLKFASTPTIKYNQTVSGDYKPVLLFGGIDYTAVANDIIGLIYDGTYWREINTSKNYAIETGTFDVTFTADSVTATFSYELYANNLVKLSWPLIDELTGGATGHKSTTTAVPASIRPVAYSGEIYLPIVIWDATLNDQKWGNVEIDSNGYLWINDMSLTNHHLTPRRGTGYYTI